MKIKLPLIEIKTGKDSNPVDASVPSATTIPVDSSNLKDKDKFFDILGGMLDMTTARLSSEKSISSRLLEANKDWVYRNNDVLAQEVSKIDFELYQVGLSKGEIVYTEVEEHPLLTLLDQFNSTTTKSDGLYNTQSHKKLTGDAFWLLTRNGSQITDIHILQPDKVTLDLGDPNKGEPLVRTYKYRDQVEGKDVEITYQPEEIIHFKKPNPKNPYRGLGAVEAIADTIDTDNLANLVQKNFFKKGAITNFVLTTDSKVTEAQLKRLKADMKANNAGAQNAFELMVLSGGLKPASVGYSNRDLQLTDLLRWYRDKIMVAFGNTPAAIGIIEDVNRANSESTLATWKRNSVKPDMDSIVNTLNEFLVPIFGKNLILGYVDPVPEDRTDDVTEATQLKNAGIIMINEARELLGYDSIDGGDIFAPQGVVDVPAGDNKPSVDDETADDAGEGEDVNPSDEEEIDAEKSRILRKTGRNLKGLGNVPPSLRHLDVKQILRKRKFFTLKQYNKDVKEEVKPMIRKLLAAGKTKDEAVAEAEQDLLSPHFTNDVVMEFYEKQIHTVDVLEQAFQKALIQFINELKAQALDNFDVEISNKTEKKAQAHIKKLVTKDQFSLFDDEALQVKAQLDLTPILMNQVVIAGQSAYDLISKEDTYVPYKVADTVAGNVTKFTQSMIDTDRDHLSKLISGGIEEGKSVPEIRNAISNEFDDISKKQSTRITRTEVMRASNLANLDAYKQSGLVAGKQWLTAGATDECSAYEGKVEGLDSNFYAIGNEFDNGDPPLHPNCRCVIIPVLESSGDAAPGSDGFADDLATGVAADALAGDGSSPEGGDNEGE
jgi:HK97 family phage portal protein